MKFSTKKFNEITKFMNLAELARASGLQQPTLSSLKLGKISNPTANTLASITKALGVPMESFFE